MAIRRSKREFSEQSVDNRKEQIKSIAELNGVEVENLEIYKISEKRKRKIFFNGKDDAAIKTLVATKSTKAVFIDIKSESVSWLKICYQGEVNEPELNVISKLNPTIRVLKYNGEVQHYWCIKTTSERDALNLQKAIAEKTGGTCLDKLPSKLRLPDDTNFKDDKSANNKGFKTSWSDVGDIEYFYDLVLRFDLDLLPIPQVIQLEGLQPKCIEKKYMPYIVNDLSVDLAHHSYGDVNCLNVSLLALTSSVLGTKVSLLHRPENLLSESKTVPIYPTFSACLLGRDNDGSTQVIKLIQKALNERQQLAFEEAKRIKRENKIQATFKTKMSDAYINMAVKETMRVHANSQGVAHQAPLNDLAKAEQYAEEVESQKKFFSIPLFITNDVCEVIENCPYVNGTLFTPLNTGRLFNKLSADEETEHKFSELLLGGDINNVTVLANCSINHWDSRRQSSQEDITPYTTPANCFDIYLGMPNTNIPYGNTSIYSESVFEQLKAYINDLHNITERLEGGITIPLAPESSELLEDFYCEIDQLVRTAPNDGWTKNRLRNLEPLALKLVLNIGVLDSFDFDEMRFEENDSNFVLENISKNNMEKAIALTKYVGEHILMLSFDEHIDHVNAVSIAPKLRLLKGEFTARTLYKDKGWAGVKNNPARAKGALAILASYHWVCVVRVIEKDEEDILIYRTNPILLTNSVDRLAPIAPSDLLMTRSMVSSITSS